MKILVFSDSHGVRREMADAVERERPDMIIHLGDFIADFKALRELFPETEAYGVRGNCDLRSLMGRDAEKMLITAGGKKILIAHGHQYGVKLGLERFFFAAMEAGADIALFGHTHMPYIGKAGGAVVMNPGSIGRSPAPSYGLISVDGGEMETKIIKAASKIG